MLVIGTCKEHFGAVWVKNEWSRYLALLKKDRSRLLIPCYRDMDAYDLPDELSHLQSQDMSKVGFIQDVLRGVKKVLDAGKAPDKSTTGGTTQSGPGVESLLKRGWLILEDSDWDQAKEYFNKVLDIDPESASAYAGLLCVELRVKQEGLLADRKEPFTESSLFQKAVRFADAGYRATLNGYDQKVRERLRHEEYDRLVQAKSRASESDYCTLAKAFREMGEYKDADALADECENQYRTLKEQREEQERQEHEKRAEKERRDRMEEERRRTEEQYRQLIVMAKQASTADEWQQCATAFREMMPYKNTEKLAEQCLEKQYRLLTGMLSTTVTNGILSVESTSYKYLATKFREMGPYKNAEKLTEQCEKKYRIRARMESAVGYLIGGGACIIILAFLTGLILHGCR